MATTIQFDDGAGHILTLPAPSAPYNPGDNYPMIIGECWGGGLKFYDMGDGSNAFDDPEIHFEYLTDSDDGSVAGYQSLYTYISSTLSWGSVAFTYTDIDGTLHTNMHYVGGLPFTRLDGELWEGTLELKKDLSI